MYFIGVKLRAASVPSIAYHFNRAGSLRASVTAYRVTARWPRVDRSAGPARTKSKAKTLNGGVGIGSDGLRASKHTLHGSLKIKCNSMIQYSKLLELVSVQAVRDEPTASLPRRRRGPTAVVAGRLSRGRPPTASASRSWPAQARASPARAQPALGQLDLGPSLQPALEGS